MIVLIVLKVLLLNGRQTHGTSEIKDMVTNLMNEYLSSEHSAIQKVVSDLSGRIDKLQAHYLVRSKTPQKF